jgi:predicted transcriptional regulator
MAKSISIKLPEDIYQWLIEESERDDRTKSAIMLRALREYRAKREADS